MLVTIDDSGDPGFSEGSSPYLVFGLIIFDAFEDAEVTGLKVKALQRELNIKPEFKFSGTSDRNKDVFFERICSSPFKVRAIYIDKSKIYSPDLRSSPIALYNFALKMVLQHDGGRLNKAHVKIDAPKAKDERTKAMLAYLTREVCRSKVAKVKPSASHSDSLIQLADMCVGALARPYNPRGQRKNPHKWSDMLKRSGKVENEWHFE